MILPTPEVCIAARRWHHRPGDSSEGEAMKKALPANASRGAVAAGATAAGAASFGAMALGAVAFGAMAVGALAVGRLTVGRARLRRVEIGELAVGRLEIGAGAGGALAAVARIRAAPGKGDALERLVREEGAEGDPGGLLYRAHRSRTDPDLFLFHAAYAEEAGFEEHAQAARFDALLREAAEQGLVAVSRDEPVEVEFYRAI
jgi:quinol monooxygenase YgiN